MIDDYLASSPSSSRQLPDGYHELVAEADGVRHALAAHPVPLRSPATAIRSARTSSIPATRMWIVDWEYSGMNDPMWDLGDLSVEGGFDAAQDQRLLDTYFGGPRAPSIAAAW